VRFSFLDNFRPEMMKISSHLLNRQEVNIFIMPIINALQRFYFSGLNMV
jgi:hypothetical protein